MENESRIPVDASKSKVPWLSLKDLPIILIAIPFMLLFGAHLALVAIGIRKWTRIPYSVSMIGLYLLITIPLVLLRDNHSIWIPLGAIFVIQFSLLGALALSNEWLDGNNIEMVAVPHFLTVICYMLLPMIYTVVDRA